MRGIGKTKLIHNIKPNVIPENHKFSLYYIDIMSGSGYDFVVDEICYKLGIDSSMLQSEQIDAVAVRIIDAMRIKGHTCLIIDDIGLIQGRDNQFLDNRVEMLLEQLLALADGNQIKFILTSARKGAIFKANKGVIVNMSRLEDGCIRFIIEYCSSKNLYSAYVNEDIVKAIHGNPLAAVLFAQIVSQNTGDSYAKTASLFKNFEEKHIKNLIGEIKMDDEERELIELLSISNSYVEYEFIENKAPNLICAYHSLCNRFIIEHSIENELLMLHPLIKSHYQRQIPLERQISMHNIYADFYEDKVTNNQKGNNLSPTLIANTIYHLGGSLQRNKLFQYKNKYIEQLRPIAHTLFSHRDYKHAAEYFRVIYDSLGDLRIDTILKLAQCYVYMDNIDDAEKFFKIAAEKRPDGAYLYARYAIALSSKYENLSMAETYAFRAEEIYHENPKNGRWKRNLAEIKFAQAKTLKWTNRHRAIKLFKEACLLEPANCYYLCTLANTLFKAGIIEEAVKAFEKAKLIDPASRSLEYTRKLLSDELANIELSDENEEEIDENDQSNSFKSGSILEEMRSI